MGTAIHADLMQRAIEGDTVAVTVLLACIHSRLRTHLQRRIPRSIQSRVDRDDILQETHVQVFHHIRTFQDRGPDSFYRWAATIALHRLRNVIKSERTLKRGRGRTLGEQGAAQGSFLSLLGQVSGCDPSPSRAAASSEAQAALSLALEQLPEHYRQAVRLVYLEGRSVEEAARIMGRTERAIHNLCYKAKERLHAHMGSTSRFFSRF